MIERVLIVDRDPPRRDALSLLLASEECRVDTAADAVGALDRMRTQRIDLVLCDSRVQGLDGFALVPQISRALPRVPVVLTGAGPAAELASQALESGAFGHLACPVEPAELQILLQRAREAATLRHTHEQLRRDLDRATGERPIVAASAAMIQLLELIERAAGSGSNALLRGEPGTGKEVLARTIHAQSLRRDHPFVPLDCAGVPEAELERGLFGHEAEHGSLALAHRGTLFIDEVVALPMHLQAKLVQTIQDRRWLPHGEDKPVELDLRVIASTRIDLETAVAEGRFRSDLYYRLAVIDLEIPALRDRREDIPLLCDHFLARFGRAIGRDVRSISDEALERLTGYAWPGNLRELENVMERAAMLAGNERIGVRELPAAVADGAESAGDAPRSYALKRARRAFEADCIRRALRATDGNRTHAARLLEISHRALLYKIKEFGLRD